MQKNKKIIIIIYKVLKFRKINKIKLYTMKTIHSILVLYTTLNAPKLTIVKKLINCI